MIMPGAESRPAFSPTPPAIMESAPTASSVFPYLRSCTQETEKPIDGHLTGEIPRWLKGVLIRIGSGLLEIGPDRYNHVFDGMALMHQFSFRDGKVTYQNRFLRSNAYRDNMRANRIVVSEFATRGAPDPCKTIFQRFSSLFNFDDFTDNDLVNVVMYGNEAFACSETNNIWKIDVETLESVQKVNLRKYLPVDGAIAHPHEDTDGTVYNIGTSYGLYSNYNVIKFPTKGEANPFAAGSVVCRIPASRTLQPSYYHSFAMTEGHFVMVEQPLYMSLAKMTLAHFFAGTYSSALSWDPEALCRFHVVRRSDGKLLETRYVATPFFVFHHINAYEEDGHLVMDLCGYEKGEVVNMLYVQALEDMFANRQKCTQDPFVSRARRYVLPLDIDKKTKVAGENLVTLPNCKAAATLNADGSILCSCEILTDEPWSPELPRINYEKFNGRKYRYFYAMARNDTLERTHLVKVDTYSKQTVSWHEDGVIPSEPVFLAEPEPENREQEEDSGVVVASLLYRSDETKVSLLVLDARTMAEVGRVTFETPSKVPGDFHGTFCARN